MSGMKRTRATAAILTVGLLLDGCVEPPSHPQDHVGTCSHYNSRNHRFEDVPNCLLRGRNTLINGLPPVNTEQQP